MTRVAAAGELDAERAGRIVGEQFAALAPVTASYLGEGWDNLAFDVNGEWVFRFPKRADVERQLLLEIRLLPLLAASPIAVPAYVWHGRPSALFPRHFGGYARLPGRPAIDAARAGWAAALGRFFSWLHAFPAGAARAAGVPHQRSSALIEALRADALADVHRLGEVAPDAPLEAWHAFIRAGAARPESPPADVLLHGDFSGEHALFEPASGRLTGIIDWSEVAVGDPAIDLSGLFHWGGPAFARRVLAEYRGTADEATVARAQYLAACRGVGDVAFGLQIARPAYVEAGLRALRSCVPAAPPAGGAR